MGSAAQKANKHASIIAQQIAAIICLLVAAG